MKKTDKKQIEDILALTPTQEGMLFHYLKEPKAGYYSEQLSLRITGHIDPGLFEQTWNFVIDTNEVLRAVFQWERVETPLQLIQKTHKIRPGYYNLSTTKGREKEESLQIIKTDDRKKGFDLRTVPFRVTLCKLQENQYEMIIANHHILYDGWSSGIILKEFLHAYADLSSGKTPLKPVKTKFKEFLKWNRSQDQGEHEKFWRDYLKDVDTPTGLPVKKRLEKKNLNPGYENYQATFTNAFQKLAKKTRISSEHTPPLRGTPLERDLLRLGLPAPMASWFYGAWGILLRFYTNSDEVMFGTTVSGRSASLPGIEEMVGLFINTLPLRFQIHPYEKIGDFLQRIDRSLRARQDFESTSLAKIKKYGELNTNEELFDTIIVVENYPLPNLSQKDHPLSIDSYSMVEMSHYDLSLSITIREEIEVNAVYKSDLFEAGIIRDLVHHFYFLLENMADNPGQRVTDLEILPDEEKQELLSRLNNAYTDNPIDKTLPGLFEEQVRRTPDQVALVSQVKDKMPPGKNFQVLDLSDSSDQSDQSDRSDLSYRSYISITYRELNERSGRLAGVLIEKGVRPDTIVGIMAEPSVDMVIGILGILKAGGAYLPIDPAYPQERIDYMLADSSAKLLVTTGARAEHIGAVRELPLLEMPPQSIALEKAPSISTFTLTSTCQVCPANLAYIIYTSGTTGKPKGCLVEHHNIASLMKTGENLFHYDNHDTWTMFHSFCFDFSVWEMYGALLYGGKLVLIPRLTARDPRGYLETLKKQAVTILNQTPTVFYQIIREEMRIPSKELHFRFIIFGGEALKPAKLQPWKEKYPGTRLINMYGITETTVHVTFKEITSKEIAANLSNIGKPISSLWCGIINKDFRLLPGNVPGELVVGGQGVARGYLNRPELTAEKFYLQPGINMGKAPLKAPRAAGPWTPRKSFLKKVSAIHDGAPSSEDYEISQKLLEVQGAAPPPFNMLSTVQLEPLLRAKSQEPTANSTVSGRRRLINFYRTGDLVRLIDNAEMEYLGRLDHQVKIRGNRVETGEIEHRMRQVRGITEALVLAHQNENGDTYLCAYMKLALGKEANPSELRAALSKNLPDYMIPSYFIPLKEFPLTTSGKVDRRKFPLPAALRPNLETAYTPPDTGLARAIAAAWKEVLKVEKVGIHDNFFDLGGTSLDIVRLYSRLKEVLGIDIPVVTLFEYPTIHAFLGHIQPQLDRAAGPSTDSTAPKEPGLDTTGKLHPPGDQIKENEIAVIGMAGRFPGARSIAEFWENLQRGRESIYFFSKEELIEAGASPGLPENLDYIKAKGVLEDAAYFDATFFNYTLREAGIMDPQLRLLHESGWQALEDAGLNPEAFEGSIGVYVGGSTHAYWISRILSLMRTPSANFGAISVNDGYSFSTQLAYRLNLKGPAVTVQTACSTSLVAIHMASRALLNGECDVALAGGVSLLLPIKTGYLYQAGMVHSQDGHCRAFDANATGTVGGNGIGLVVLKPLAMALEDRDHIYAMVKGTAVNNDGNRKVGYSAPSVKGQAEVIRKAQQAAGTVPGTITYIETHGTGTRLGDPVETRALVQAFETPDRPGAPNKKGKKICRIGSVKSNVGHLDAAAGAAGFIKTVLALYHRAIPPTLHYETPNPEIDFENSPFMVNTTLYDWNREKERKPLRAGVSSFGIGGTNAHVILEEWPGEHKISRKLLEVQGAAPPPFNMLSTVQLEPILKAKSQEPTANSTVSGRRRHINLLLVSARSTAALERNTHNLVEYLKQNPHVDFADVVYTMQVGRKSFVHRRALVCRDAAEAVEILSAGKSKKVYTHEVTQENPPVIFMFAGLGSQYVNMGRGLYDTEPVFRRETDRCFRILEPLADYDIKEILYPAATQPGKPGGACRTMIDQPAISQAAIFVFEYALAQLVLSWGIKPHALIGYSFGEYTAACIAGVFSLEDALTLIVYRGKLVKETPAGGMLSVPLSRGEILPLLSNRENLSLAIDNGESCVVSGMKSAVDAFETYLKEKKLLCMRINTNHALHSALMENKLPDYAARLGEIPLEPPRYPYISNVTGQWITDAEATDPGYWCRHLAQTVEFARGISELAKEPGAVFLELGPGRDLTVQVRRYLKENQQAINLARPQDRPVSDLAYLLDRLGRLWCWGNEIDWKGYYQGRDGERYRQSLPTYSFERQKFDLEGSGGVQPGTTEPGPALYLDSSNSTTYRRPSLPDNFEPPRDEIEKRIVAQFQEIFGISPIGIHEDFFELGGDSLKVITLVTQLHQELGLDIPMEAVFKNPTVEEIAEFARQIHGQPAFAMISAVEQKEYYPLASPQRRVFILDQIEEKNRAYQMPTVLWLKGVLDITLLEKAYRTLLERHEALRTGFFLEKGEPVQRVYSMDEIEFSLEYHDIATESTEGTEQAAPAAQEGYNELVGTGHCPVLDLITEFFRPFELSRPPLWRVGIVRVEIEKYLLMQNLHHIISDDISLGVMITELALLMREETEGLTPLPVQYKDYAVWQQKTAPAEVLEKQKAFWLGRYPVGGSLPVLGMPYDYPRPPVQTFEGAQIQAKPGAGSGEAWQTLARNQKTTLFVLLFTAYQVLLHSYTQQEDIIVGVPITGRSHRDVQQVVGMFVNTLAMRIYPRVHRRFEDFLQEVKEETLAAFAHQLYPFEDLVEQLDLPRDISRNPLFDTMFVLHTVDLGKIDIPGVTLTPYEMNRRAAKFDITMNAAETTMGLNLELEYNTSLFKKITMQQFMEDYIFILETVSSNPGIHLGEIKTYPTKKREADKKRILYEFNCRGAGFPGGSTIHGLFEEQVERTPDRVALVGPEEEAKKRRRKEEKKKEEPFGQFVNAFGDGYLTYSELNERSDRLAGWLIEKGVQPETIVGIMAERSVEMVIGIMGILKAGGAYLPIDPGYPEKRKKYLLADSGAKVLLSEENHFNCQLSIVNCQLSMMLSGGTGQSLGRTGHCPVPTHLSSPHLTHQNLAYIIYTSGSTGKPKGVMAEHRSVVNVLYALAVEYPLGENDTYLLKTSFLFDVSVTELFGWFWQGGRLAVLEKDGEIDPVKLLESIRRYRVTHINFVPSMFSVLVDHLTPGGIGQLSGLRYIFLAGEVLQPQPVEKFKGFVPGVLLENLYGPTEAAIYASHYSLRDWNSSKSKTKIPIGRPLPNINLYILDNYMQLQGIGGAGELGISGEGIARGYLNQPGLTAEKFLDIKIEVKGEKISILNSSYRSYRSNKSYRSYKSYIKLYKTGDLARWLPGGNIEFLGRMDHQVKVRGNRVELGEIEYHLLKHPGIKEAVVIAREYENREVTLWAYMVSDRELAAAEIREFLGRGIPDYMIPAYFIQIPRLYYTSSGKIDRRALPKAEGLQVKTGADYVSPGSDLEKIIAGAWQKELKLERVGVNDNFMDLGGTSLKIIRVASRLKAVLGREVPVVTLFRYPTVRSLAGFLSQGGPEATFRDRTAIKQKGRERLNKKRDLKQ